uniref:DUF1538 domain-containing protein n=1 Tax=Candidatus Kentrum sp. DK TaxID=2126562 RepID=A0A450TAS0_9GAMM|nr:MAG: Protein of unknown function (DUF1538) [Candidatus Kentron sp. DK]VFJ66545.1 MAG: Protein of unknown function (DUF1538) [Candidatus Kentron sp. DK]
MRYYSVALIVVRRYSYPASSTCLAIGYATRYKSCVARWKKCILHHRANPQLARIIPRGNDNLYRLLITIGGSIRDLAPVILVIGFFQIVILGNPIPNLGDIAVGIVLVLLGLTLFVRGLEIGLFPLGEALAYSFAKKGSLWWLLIFAFSLGFGTTVAEPALIAVAKEAANVAVEAGMIQSSEAARMEYALGLRFTVALSVGFAIVLGVFRILRGWPVQYLILGGYAGVVIMTGFAPEEIIGIAYDSGGVTTSTITVPMVTALGVGLASSIQGRNPFSDGFGLIAFASLTPMIFVMGYGMLIQ